MKKLFVFCFLSAAGFSFAQENPLNNPVQTQTQLRVNELVEKKAEYHRLTEGKQDGYRIKIHSGVDRDAAEAIKGKCTDKFNEVSVDMEYQQPNFVVLVGDYKTKLEAFEARRNIQLEFPSAFIVKGKVNVK